METSGSQRASVQLSKSSIIVLLASVVVCGGWRLVGLRLAGPAINSIVCVAAIMAKIGGRALKLVCGIEGWWVRNDYFSGPSWGGVVAQEHRYGLYGQGCKGGEEQRQGAARKRRLVICCTACSM